MTRHVMWLVMAIGLAGCRPQPRVGGGRLLEAPPPSTPAPTTAFADNFDSGTLDPQLWNPTSGDYSVVDGALFVRNAHNHPAWLTRRLTCDVRIDFTAWSDSPDGDIKVEVMGDGTSYDPNGGDYQATGYVFIFGGWHNSTSTIVRQDEHHARLAVDTTRRVEEGRRYAWSIRFAGGHIEWWLDGALFLQADDPQPLCGPGHDHFGVNDWTVPLHFDDLRITPAGAS